MYKMEDEDKEKVVLAMTAPWMTDRPTAPVPKTTTDEPLSTFATIRNNKNQQNDKYTTRNRKKSNEEEVEDEEEEDEDLR